MCEVLDIYQTLLERSTASHMNNVPTSPVHWDKFKYAVRSATQTAMAIDRIACPAYSPP